MPGLRKTRNSKMISMTTMMMKTMVKKTINMKDLRIIIIKTISLTITTTKMELNIPSTKLTCVKELLSTENAPIRTVHSLTV